MTQFGERLRVVRKQLGLTQRAFAQAIGITQGYLSEVETGKAKASIDIAIGVAREYPTINIQWLLAERGLVMGDASVTSKQEITIMRTLIRVAWHLSERERFIQQIAKDGDQSIILANTFCDLYLNYQQELEMVCASGITDEKGLIRALVEAQRREVRQWEDEEPDD